MRYLAGAAQGARRVSAGAHHESADARQCPRSTLRRMLSSAIAKQSTTMVFVQLLSQLLKDAEHRHAHGADRRRRGAHLRHADRCSARSASIPRSASSTSRRTTTSCSTTARRRTARSSRKASPRRARFRRGSPRRRRYSAHGTPMLPFYIFYSMFGFQRVGDLIWAAARFARARLPDRRHRRAHHARRRRPAAPGRLLAPGRRRRFRTAAPTIPCFGYELAAIVEDGARRMLEQQEDVFYYLTVTNENYAHPAMPRARTRASCAACISAQEKRERARCSCSAAGRSCAK